MTSLTHDDFLYGDDNTMYRDFEKRGIAKKNTLPVVPLNLTFI